MLDKILFIDLETTKEGKILKDGVGALFSTLEYHGTGLERIEEWIRKADYLCGHNIIAHDLPILKKRLGSEVFQGKKIIDTLLWSPLLFANRPYHKLVKGYQLVNDQDSSNPLSDCKLCKELLLDEIGGFKRLGIDQRAGYFGLLHAHKSYKDFFDIVGEQHTDRELISVIELLSDGNICTSVHLNSYIHNEPRALAYALAVIATKQPDSVLSQWALHQIPRAQSILQELRFRDCTDPTCTHCSIKLNPTKALVNYFGFEDFRSFDDEVGMSIQERTVRKGLSKESFVAVFPTGGGKSLTFQLPALMAGEMVRQLTVVISPLVSLMKDQVDNLQSKFSITRAVAINGLLSPLERQDAIEQVADGRASLLYISPESLRSKTILRLLQNRSIARFVIDEAHCFSSWGHDFRVDYLYIADFINLLQEHSESHIPVSCFTATAKPQVVEDIKAYFKERLDVELSEFISRAARKNLMYEVINIEDGERKMKELLSLLDRCEKPAIVYASRTKKVVQIAELISATGMSCTYFHGKMKSDDKKKNQDSFMAGDTDIIVATSAFGMGVDKDNVKTVIHYDISDSLENYVQEAGRAGRDEDIKAKCYILFHEDDLNKHFSLAQQTKLNIKEIQQIWKAIKNQNKYRDRMSNSALQIAKKAGWDTELRELENKVTAAIAALEDRNFLRRTQNSPQIFANSLLIKNINDCVRIIRESQAIDERSKQDCNRVLQRIMKDEECRVDYLAEVLSMRMSTAQDAIHNLRSLKILGDTKDLTAFVSLTRSKRGSRPILLQHIEQEKSLLTILIEGTFKKSYRQLNHELQESGHKKSSAESIRTIFDYWDRRKLIKKKRVDRVKSIYEITIEDIVALKKDIDSRHEVTSACFAEIEKLTGIQNKDAERTDNLLTEFSLLELCNSIKAFLSFEDLKIKMVERALLYLHQVGAIKLEGGFMVIFNRLNVEDIDRSKTRYTLEDYNDLNAYYEHKIEQIHIVGEYAKKRLANYQDSLTYVDDYFRLALDDFKQKYFNRRGKEIKRAVTIEKFKRLVGGLDTDQMEVHTSKEKNILVLAGPGSGKTKVLVHKIASLLILEDVKPEQFLMLTFSKAAAMEFRSRVKALIPEYARLINISTFHGFCFEKLGQLGSLERSEHVIPDCIEAIEEESIDISSISNKSVLLLDEFQDVNQAEWDLILSIRKAAGDLRIIAVGDDDQNIFGFRGASNMFMTEFSEKLSAKTFSLVKNYRSGKNIVAFNNDVLRTIPDRLKSEELESWSPREQSSVSITEYRSNHFLPAVVDGIAKNKPKGTVALLARTNNEVLLAATLLREKGLRARTIAGQSGFRLTDLVEIRSFHEHLRIESGVTGLVYIDLWKKAKDDLKSKFKDSIQLDNCLAVIEHFESHFKERFEMHEWSDYIRQINIEDVLQPDETEVYVSTLHKSKGKEFDSVYLFLENYRFQSDEQLRLLYVGCSRAKQQLSVHTNQDFFSGLSQSHFTSILDETEYAPPKHFDIILEHKDVQLNSFKYTQNAIRTLTYQSKMRQGVKHFDQGDALGLANPDGKIIVLFARKYLSDKHERFAKSGYRIDMASIEYKLHWYCKDDEQEYLICLPCVSYSLDDSGI